MTKTYWNDWKNRQSETKNVIFHIPNTSLHRLLISPSHGEKIISIKFDEASETVTVKYTKHNFGIKNGLFHVTYNTKEEKFCRTEIAKIVFF